MWGWVHGLFKALFEQLFKPKPPPTVGTDPGSPGSVADFVRRHKRAKRRARSSPTGNEDPGSDG